MRSCDLTKAVLLGAGLLFTSTSARPTLPGGLSRRAVSAVNLQSTLIYDLDNESIDPDTVVSTHGVSIDAAIYIVDGENLVNNPTQLEAYQAAGKTVVCYFSAGSFEKGRSDSAELAKISDCFCGEGVSYDEGSGECADGQNKMDGWDEYWLNIHDPTCLASIKPIMEARIQRFAEAGCNGIDPDNVDSYANSQKYGTTDKDQLAYLNWLAETAHSKGLVVDLKNADDLINVYPELAQTFDFSVIEQCGDNCNAYDPFLAAGKPQIRIEYGTKYKSCDSLDLPAGVSFLQYDKDSLNSKTINLSCQGAGAAAPPVPTSRVISSAASAPTPSSITLTFPASTSVSASSQVPTSRAPSLSTVISAPPQKTSSAKVSRPHKVTTKHSKTRASTRTSVVVSPTQGSEAVVVNGGGIDGRRHGHHYHDDNEGNDSANDDEENDDADDEEDEDDNEDENEEEDEEDADDVDEDE